MDHLTCFIVSYADKLRCMQEMWLLTFLLIFIDKLLEIACPTKWLIQKYISNCYSGSIVQSKMFFKMFEAKNATTAVDGWYKKANR